MQGILFAAPDCAKTSVDLIRLWMHEAERVYRDKMVDQEDMALFDKLQKDIVKKSFEDADENILFRRPLIYCHFAQGLGDNKYLPVIGELGESTVSWVVSDWILASWQPYVRLISRQRRNCRGFCLFWFCNVLFLVAVACTLYLILNNTKNLIKYFFFYCTP